MIPSAASMAAVRSSWLILLRCHRSGRATHSRTGPMLSGVLQCSTPISATQCQSWQPQWGHSHGSGVCTHALIFPQVTPAMHQPGVNAGVGTRASQGRRSGWRSFWPRRRSPLTSRANRASRRQHSRRHRHPGRRCGEPRVRVRIAHLLGGPVGIRPERSQLLQARQCESRHRRGESCRILRRELSGRLYPSACKTMPRRSRTGRASHAGTRVESIAAAGHLRRSYGRWAAALSIRSASSSPRCQG